MKNQERMHGDPPNLMHNYLPKPSGLLLSLLTPRDNLSQAKGKPGHTTLPPSSRRGRARTNQQAPTLALTSFGTRATAFSTPLGQC